MKAHTLPVSGRFTHEPAAAGSARVAFLFPGQGSQYTGMLAPLRAALPAFEERLLTLDAAWARMSGESLLADIDRPDPASAMALLGTRKAQPAIGLVSLAAAQALGAGGVRADFLAGHSYGELVALAAAGAVDDEGFLSLSRERGRLLGEAGDAVKGAMCAVLAPRRDVEALLAQARGRVVIANMNAPRQTVVSGDEDAIRALIARGEQLGIRCAALKTSCAFHSPAMAPAMQAWRDVLDRASFAPSAATRVFANVTASSYRGSEEELRALLAEQVIAPVRWVEIVEALYEGGARVFVEVGPGRVLTDLVGRILGERAHTAVALDPGRADPHAHVANLLALLRPPASPAPAVRSPTVHAFLEANARVVEGFLAQQERLVTLAADAGADEKQRLFTSLVEANRQIVSDYLATQERALRGVSGVVALATEGAPHHVSAPAPRVLALGPSPESTKSDLHGTAATLDAPALEAWLRRAIADLTGFPPDMIRRESELEGELGLDSLTTVEIFYMLVDAYPELESRAGSMRGRRTVGELVDALTAGPCSAETAGRDEVRPPPSSSPRLVVRPLPDDGSTTGPSLRDEIVAHAVALAGTLAAEVDGDADLARDLGLDPFKREELAQALIAAHPELAVLGRELLHARTLDALVDLCSQVASPATSVATATPIASVVLERFVRVLRTAPTDARAALPASVLVAGVASPLRERFVDKLCAAGVRVSILGLSLDGWRVPGVDATVPLENDEALARALTTLRRETRDSAVIFLAAGDEDLSFGEQVELATTAPFVLAKALAERGAPRVTLFGVIGAEHGDAAWAGARGVARGLAREWPHVCVRSVWLDNPSVADPASVLRALASGTSDQDLVLRNGALLSQVLEARPISPLSTAACIDRDSLVVMLGGGDGITAEIACSIAKAHRCRIAVIGRTPLLEAARRPRADERARAVVRGASRQEALARTRSRIEASGGTFFHARADASKPDELARALDAVRAAHGPIHGLVHGVGTTCDSLVGKKSVASFRSVVHTKAHSAVLAHEMLRGEPLRFAFLFSSLAAHAGTAGQMDYIAANEILHAVARDWGKRVAYPVRALLWSVWSESGLASPALKRQMARLALPGISNAAGCEAFARELGHVSAREPWVLLSPRATLAFAEQKLGYGSPPVAELRAHA